MPFPVIRPTGPSPFDALKHVDAQGREYWQARELQELLGYETWRKFAHSIERARIACENSGQDARDHFAGAGKMIRAGKGAERQVLDFHLSRYACHLVTMNGDPRKPEIANAQTYFSVMTHTAEQLLAAPPPALSPPSAPLTPARQSLLAAQAIVDIEERTLAIERRLDNTPIAQFPEQEAVVHELCQELGWVMPSGWRAAYNAFKNHFGYVGVPLAKYSSLPSHRYEEACTYLRRLIAEHRRGQLLEHQ